MVPYLMLFLCIVFSSSTALAADGTAPHSTVIESDWVYPHIDLTSSRHTPAQIRHGEYLVKMGDCLTCHTDKANHGKTFAGGLKIGTSFGALYTPNITPDKETGIGNWSDEQFVRAVRQGIAPDGSYYYPVFPYNYFNKMSRRDVLDIKAYLDSIPSVRHKNHAQEMKWPFNYRFLQFGWRLLFFDFKKGAFKSDPKQSVAWNRGAFIVTGPGHCALCHTQLDYFGVPKMRYYLAGAFVEGYYAPNITAQGLKRLTDQSVAGIFLKDEMPIRTKLGGPMKGVEHNSLRDLSYEDMLSIATYLKSIKSESPPVEIVTNRQFRLNDGKKLYQSTCKMCHSYHVMGAPRLNKRIWDVLLGQGKNKLYEVAIRGSGNMPAKGGCDTCSNRRVEAAVDYMIFVAQKNKK